MVGCQKKVEHSDTKAPLNQSTTQQKSPSDQGDRNTNIGTTIAQQLHDELKQAKAAQDFRLYATKGRRIIIPGLTKSQLIQAKESCGLKYIVDSGDVLRSTADKEKYLSSYKFAIAYNKTMFIYCMQHHS